MNNSEKKEDIKEVSLADQLKIQRMYDQQILAGMSEIDKVKKELRDTKSQLANKKKTRIVKGD